MIGLWSRAEVGIRTQILNVSFSHRMLAAQDLEQSVFLSHRTLDDLVECRLAIPTLCHTLARGGREYNGNRHNKIRSHY